MDITVYERCLLACIRAACCCVAYGGRVIQRLKRGRGHASSLRHVAFIMDGNRRWARQRDVPVAAGHRQGFEKLKQTLQWCLDLGVEVVTVYAFSIENFRRSKEEVDALMLLAAEKLDELVDEREGLIHRLGIRVEIIGEIHLLPLKVQQSVAHAMAMSRHHNRATLNICLSYTARQDLVNAVKCCAKAVEEGILFPSDVSESVISMCLGTGHSPPVDLLLRTSGETRLSDFLLWESAYSLLSFEQTMWPDISILRLASIVINFHWWAATKRKLRIENCDDRIERIPGWEQRVSNLKRKMNEEKWEMIENIRKDAPPRRSKTVSSSSTSDRKSSSLISRLIEKGGIAKVRWPVVVSVAAVAASFLAKNFSFMYL